MRKFRYPLWAYLLIGYLAIGRPFTYLGVPPIFISELYLGWNFIRNRHNWIGQFFDDIFRFEPVTVAIAVNLAWGIVEVFRCLFLARYPIEVFRTFALSYYPLYFLVGVAIGKDWSPEQFVRIFKFILIFYIPYAIFTNLYLAKGGGAVDFGLPMLCPVMPAAVMALWPYLRNWRLRHVAFVGTAYPVIFVNGNGRAWLLGLLAGLGMVVIASQMKIKRLLIYGVSTITALTIIGPFVVSADGRRSLDPVVFVAKVVAAVDSDLAVKILEQRGYPEEADTIIMAAGTARWRQQIWRGAIHSLNTTNLVLMGQGGGRSMAEFVPLHWDIHTPHNFTIFCLYYVGGIGLLVYLILLTAVFMAGRSIQDLSFRAMYQGIVASTVVVALMSDCFETPYGAVPFYLLCGILLSVGRKMRPKQMPSRVARSRMNLQRIWQRDRAVPNPAFAPRPTA